MEIKNNNLYNNIISLENLLLAWEEFLKGKRGKKDVVEFELRLMENLLSLHEDLKSKTYKHSAYEAFNISDPKPRNIHKAKVRDRLLRHAIHRILYPYFDKKFIYDSYSYRKNKGIHKAIGRFKKFSLKVSRNNTKTVWVLKCDIRKFFASINKNILIKILEKHILDTDTLWLLQEIIGSFKTAKGKGLPLGNLTSQLLVNIHMNEFDQWMKYKMKVKYYIRYADDFVILSSNKEYLVNLTSEISEFLSKKLKLALHPNKVFIKTLTSGVDFLGWVHFPNYKILRTTTKRRMFKKLKENNFKKESVKSYLGMMKWGNCFRLVVRILNQYVV